MAEFEASASPTINSRFKSVVTSSFSSYDERNPLVTTRYRESGSPEAIRPCYYLLQILGMWKPQNEKFGFIWRFYRSFVCILWLVCLAAIMCLDFVHYGFDKAKIHERDIINSVCTCLNFLSPFVFTLYYFKHGRYVELVFSVQDVSQDWKEKLNRISRWYTLASVCLWGLCVTFLMFHWLPFFSKWWHYGLYIPAVVYISGWWSTWLSIYGFVCHVHSLQIDTVVEEMKSRECRPTTILQKHFQLQTSLEQTQKDFNFIISLALAYHTLDLIIFSFAYFSSAFGTNYPIWQYVGAVLFDLISITFKLYPPAIVAAASHRLVVQASKRCHPQLPPLTNDLPLEDMQLFQYMAWCESDMGLKILGIRITVELAMKILMTISTAAISFVAFVIPKLNKYR